MIFPYALLEEYGITSKKLAWAIIGVYAIIVVAAVFILI